MKKTRQAFTVIEVLISIVAISSLYLILYFVTKPVEKVQSINKTKDEMVASAIGRAIQIYIADHAGIEGLIPDDLKTGFYEICNQDVTGCTPDKKLIDLDVLVTEEYIRFIPKNSAYSSEVSSGYVIRYQVKSENITVLTYAQWESLGRP